MRVRAAWTCSFALHAFTPHTARRRPARAAHASGAAHGIARVCGKSNGDPNMGVMAEYVEVKISSIYGFRFWQAQHHASDRVTIDDVMTL